jgi:hypothetical protein
MVIRSIRVARFLLSVAEVHSSAGRFDRSIPSAFPTLNLHERDIIRNRLRK